MRLGARFAFVTLVLGASAAACNAITGANERKLDPDLGEIPDRDTGPDDDKDTGGNTILEAGPQPDNFVPDAPVGDVDAGPIVLVVNTKGTWVSHNGGTPMVVANGVKIVGADASANSHPIIVPSPQPAITSDNYTVRATVRAPPALAYIPEFGIALRFQPDKSCIVMANAYGATPPPFMGQMPSGGADPWNPSKSATGQNYGYSPSAQYKFYVRVIGSEARGKFWLASDAEPASDQLLYASPYATGRGVGFYTYGIIDAVLEEMTVTIP